MCKIWKLQNLFVNCRLQFQLLACIASGLYEDHTLLNLRLYQAQYSVIPVYEPLRDSLEFHSILKQANLWLTFAKYKIVSTMSCCLRADLNCFSASRYNPNLKRQQRDIEGFLGVFLLFYFFKKKNLLNNEAVHNTPNMNCPKAYFKVIYLCAC